MTTMPDPVRWLTTKNAAELVHRSKRTIRLWIKEGELRTRKEGGITQVRMDDLEATAKAKDAYRESPTFGR